MGQTPCVLCWFQRAFMFPLAVILAVSCFISDAGVWRYALPLAAIGWVIALYHSLVYSGFIPEGIEPCGSGPSCSGAEHEHPWAGFRSRPCHWPRFPRSSFLSSLFAGDPSHDPSHEQTNNRPRYRRSCSLRVLHRRDTPKPPRRGCSSQVRLRSSNALVRPHCASPRTDRCAGDDRRVLRSVLRGVPRLLSDREAGYRPSIANRSSGRPALHAVSIRVRTRRCEFWRPLGCRTCSSPCWKLSWRGSPNGPITMNRSSRRHGRWRRRPVSTCRRRRR